MVAETTSQARLFAQLIETLEPEIRRAFLASVTDLTANVDWAALIAALEQYNIDAAIDALHIEPAAWAEYSASVTSAYAKAGSATAAQIIQQGIGTIGTRFNMSNPRAEAWIRQHVGESVTGFTREQVRAARDLIEAGYSKGQGPRNIATDLVGRVSGGQRQGGIMGLDVPRANRFMKVSEGMKTAEGVRDLVVVHNDGSLSIRYQVNKATAQRIISAYKKGEAVPTAQRITSDNQYKNALLKSRADTVAATETGNAVMGARYEQWKQLAEAQGLDASAVKKTWRHRRGASKYHRPEHLAMSGKSVQGLDTPFVFPDGAVMLYSHDRRGGAKHIINCGCDVTMMLEERVS